MIPDNKRSPLQWGFDKVGLLTLCLDKKVCCISFKDRRTHCVDIHHCNAIGMGSDRNIFDDSKCKKMALTREYHTEYHVIGREAFEKKYGVFGVIYNTDETDPMEEIE